MSSGRGQKPCMLENVLKYTPASTLFARPPALPLHSGPPPTPQLPRVLHTFSPPTILSFIPIIPIIITKIYINSISRFTVNVANMRRGGGQPQVGNYVNQKGTAAGSNRYVFVTPLFEYLFLTYTPAFSAWKILPTVLSCYCFLSCSLNLETHKPLLIYDLISNSGGGTPDNIQCQVCKKMKPKGQYANRQLQKYSAFNKSCKYSLTPKV